MKNFKKICFFFSSRRRHTRSTRDWSSDVCSSDLQEDIMRDLSLLELFAQKTANREALLRIVDLPAAIEHLSDSLRRELDFELEAQNVERLRSALAAFPRL